VEACLVMRIGPVVIASALACVLSAVFGSSAFGAEVYTGHGELHFRAAPGEANRVVVDDMSYGAVIDISDRGARLRSGRGCRKLTAHRVRCRSDFFEGIRIATGDRNDTVRSGRNAPGLIVNAGSGRDRVRGGNGFNEIDGGPGNDLLDGGRGRFNTAVYSSHRRGVMVDLAAGRATGFGGERDRLRNFEWIRGGRGSDVLLGDRGGNTIDGGPGRDWIDGRGGNDELGGGAGLDFERCGRGDDLVSPAGDFVTPDCETVNFGDPSEGGDQFRPYPRIRRGVPTFRIDCPDQTGEGDESPCAGRISLRTGRGRLLGDARIRRHQFRAVRVRVHLTRLGRALAHSPLGVRTTVRINGLNLSHFRWQIRLRIPPL
jgi:hypothetical protein